MTKKPVLNSFFALLIASVLAAGCGGVPGNAVATVEGDPIEKADFDRWMAFEAKRSRGPQAKPFDPPEFEDCVAQLRRQLPKPAKNAPKVTDKQLVDQCKQEYEGTRDRVMELLISQQWIAGQAEEMDISLSDSELDKAVAEAKKQQFPGKGEFERFLKQNGLNESDVRESVRTEKLVEKIRKKILSARKDVTEADIKAYYAKNEKQFAQPESRDVSVILTKSRARAEKARSELADGESFSSVAKKYSEDESSKAQGGKIVGVTEGSQDRALDKAVFSAKKGKLTGPVKSEFGYYVLRVDKVNKAKQASLDESRTQIVSALNTERETKLVEKFLKGYEKKWKERTECQDGFEMALCEEAPKSSGSPTPTPATP